MNWRDWREDVCQQDDEPSTPSEPGAEVGVSEAMAEGAKVHKAMEDLFSAEDRKVLDRITERVQRGPILVVDDGRDEIRRRFLSVSEPSEGRAFVEVAIACPPVGVPPPAEPEHDIMCFCLQCAPNQRCEPGPVVLATEFRYGRDALGRRVRGVPDAVNGTPWPLLSPEERRGYTDGQFDHEAFETDEAARVLVAEGYKQTSRKFRHVARLPRGKSGLEALKEADPEGYAHIMDNAERQAADTYRRIHARGPDKLSLTVEGFEAFRKAGGEPSW